MKKLLIALVACVMLAGCGDSKVLEGTKYPTYGFLTEQADKDPNVRYRLIMGNVIWSVLLVETIAAPVYFVGFSLYEPVELINQGET
jgi:hypothetical protein